MVYTQNVNQTWRAAGNSQRSKWSMFKLQRVFLYQCRKLVPNMNHGYYHNYHE